MIRILFILTFVFLSAAGFSQTRTELQVSELQKPITEHIEKNYDGFRIGKIFKVDARGSITYDVCISKGTEYEKLIYDKDGRFLKKESCCHDCCIAPPKK